MKNFFVLVSILVAFVAPRLPRMGSETARRFRLLSYREQRRQAVAMALWDIPGSVAADLAYRAQCGRGRYDGFTFASWREAWEARGLYALLIGPVVIAMAVLLCAR